MCFFTPPCALLGAQTALTQTFVRCRESFEGPQTPFNQQKLITHMVDKGLVDSCSFVITMGAVAGECVCRSVFEVGGESFTAVHSADFFVLLISTALVL